MSQSRRLATPRKQGGDGDDRPTLNHLLQEINSITDGASVQQKLATLWSQLRERFEEDHGDRTTSAPTPTAGETPSAAQQEETEEDGPKPAQSFRSWALSHVCDMSLEMACRNEFEPATKDLSSKIQRKLDVAAGRWATHRAVLVFALDGIKAVDSQTSLNAIIKLPQTHPDFPLVELVDGFDKAAAIWSRSKHARPSRTPDPHTLLRTAVTKIDATCWPKRSSNSKRNIKSTPDSPSPSVSAYEQEHEQLPGEEHGGELGQDHGQDVGPKHKQEGKEQEGKEQEDKKQEKQENEQGHGEELGQNRGREGDAATTPKPPRLASDADFNWDDLSLSPSFPPNASTPRSFPTPIKRYEGSGRKFSIGDDTLDRPWSVSNPRGLDVDHDSSFAFKP